MVAPDQKLKPKCSLAQARCSNKMKVLVIGDMHLKVQTMGTMVEARESILNLTRELKPDYVALIGDQLDGHDTLKLACLAVPTEFVTSLAEYAKVIMLVGNHDMLNNQQYCSDYHAFTSMKSIPNLLVVDKPIVCNPDACGTEPALICTPFLPKGSFCRGMDEFLPSEWQDWRQRTADAVLLAHQEFRGAIINMAPSTKGDAYEAGWPRVFSGHIHERHTVGENVHYVGTPWSTSFGSGGACACWTLART